MKIFSTVCALLVALTFSIIISSSFDVAELAPFIFGGSVIASLVMAHQGLLFTTLCGEITKDIDIDCDNPLISGAKDELILINVNDLDSLVRNGVNTQIIENMVLASGKQAFKYEGKNNSIEPRSALVKQRYAEVYDHEVIFKVFVNSPTVKDELEKLAKGSVIAIVQNNHKGAGGNAAYEIHGLDVGLSVLEMERVTLDADTQGAYNVTLRTPEESKEAHLPATFFLTDFTTTKALVDALLV